jgi:four helix bundle protein
MTPDDIASRLLDFACSAGKIADALPDTRLGRHIAGELVRACTSPVPNYDEAGAAESREDFVQKISICLREMRGSRGWLRLILRGELLTSEVVGPVLSEADQLCGMLGESLDTAKRHTRRWANYSTRPDVSADA